MRDDEGSALVLYGLEGADLLPGVAGPCPEVSGGVSVGFGVRCHVDWIPCGCYENAIKCGCHADSRPAAVYRGGRGGARVDVIRCAVMYRIRDVDGKVSNGGEHGDNEEIRHFLRQN